MTHNDAFLQAIIENPDDDGPRLIYADWLEEHSKAERAEFIRAQCALAFLEQNDARRPELEKREQQLLKTHEQQWVWPLRRPLSGTVTPWEFRRGFLEKVTLGARALRAEAHELFRLHPIRHLRLYGAARQIPQLVTAPYLARLKTLDLQREQIGASPMDALAGCPHVAGLRTLNLDYNQIGTVGARALAASPHLTNLTTLCLSGNQIDDGGAIALTSSPSLAGLTSLNFYWNPISDTGRAALLGRFGAGLKVNEVPALSARRRWRD